LTGFFYEQAYTDIAQVGASCQTLNSTYDAETGGTSMDFAVKYLGGLPFTIVERYTPVNASVPGYYNKNAAMPGGSLLTLPTAVVDFTLSEDGSEYTSMTLFSCIAPVGVAQVTEVIIATKTPSISAAELSQLEDTARSLGVQWSGDLTTVDHSRC